jgi:hypothetical protein
MRINTVAFCSSLCYAAEVFILFLSRRNKEHYQKMDEGVRENEEPDET